MAFLAELCKLEVAEPCASLRTCSATDACSSVRTCGSVISTSERASRRTARESTRNPSKEVDADAEGADVAVPAAAACTSFVAAVKKSAFCGASPADHFKRVHVDTPSKGDKRKSAKKHAFEAQQGIHFDPPLPSLDDSYTIVKGAQMGILQCAIHKESRQKRSVLTLAKRNIPPAPPGEDTSKEVRARLEALLKIDHVNVLTLHEACEDSKCIHLVYDWPEGGMLLGHLTSYHEDVTEAHIASVTREVLAALAAANHFSIHHLDWSLLCLFLGYKHRFSPVKVMGFGLAGVLVPLVTTRKFSRSNKHFYASPELLTENLRHMPHVKQHLCDVWSVGTLVYMLFSGRPPFFGETSEVIERVKRGAFTFGYEFDMISREAKDSIERMLTKKWEFRPNATDLLRYPFMQLQVTAKRKEGVICQDALTKLDKFAQETHCRQTLARLLADLGLQESQYADLEERFKQLDLDGNGVIEVSELCEVAASLPDSKDSEAVSKSIADIIRSCDRNDNSTVDISEFVAAVVLELEQKDERLLIKAFDKMDINRDARITKGELFRVLRQYSNSLEPDEITTFVQDMDKDLDQKIDFNEFKYLFPHVKERAEEVKAAVKEVTTYAEHQKKAFANLQTEIDKFWAKLRMQAASISQEYVKLQKGANNEREVVKKLQGLIDVVKEFAGRPQDLEIARAREDMKKHNNHLSGLTMLHKYNKVADASALPDHLSPRAGVGSPSSARSGGSPIASGSERDRSPRSDSESPRARDGTRSPRDAALGFGKSLAEFFVERFDGKHLKTKKEIEREAFRRRRLLWLGLGEGCSHVRFAMRFAETTQQHVVLGSRNRNLRQHYLKESDLDNEDAEAPVDMSPHRAHTGGGGSYAHGHRGHHDHEDGVSPQQKHKKHDDGSSSDEDMKREFGDIVPWANSKKLKGVKHAMELAKGPEIKFWGKYTNARQVRREYEQIGIRLLDEVSMRHDDHAADILVDLTKLIRYKCLRSWAPRFEIWKDTLKYAMDESKVHLHERRNLHLTCIKHATQTVERILFSTADFLVCQEEAFWGLWAIEDLLRPGPVSGRFLPYRGDVDENARTPRDEEDAEQLAPDEFEIKASMAASLAASGQINASVAESVEDHDGIMQSQQSHSHANLTVAGTAMTAMGTGLHHQKLRMNRTNVRSQQHRDPKADAALAVMTSQHVKQAQALTQTFA
eukprot:TRINITY_DN64295_c0_g1_i1.p1 TRINITY_DN64295_c0_g1~~TRINITY_DN64295_c0_g1_i1.p1  ORF type:complete len:1196 (-),score=176.02 TRINITY_DN64295_c0_g1_i1:344-3931(-)